MLSNLTRMKATWSRLQLPCQSNSKMVSPPHTKSPLTPIPVCCAGDANRGVQYPDHCIVIKYVPYVGDSKRAMDEYTSEMFMGGRSTIVMHNTCEDSLLAAPLILDLVGKQWQKCMHAHGWSKSPGYRALPLLNVAAGYPV